MKGITRKGFLGALGATLPALLLNRSAAGKTQQPPAAQPDVIQQTELQKILDDLGAADAPMLKFRRRLLAGATVENGPITLEFDGNWIKGFSPDPEDENRHGWSSLDAYGLLLDAHYED